MFLRLATRRIDVKVVVFGPNALAMMTACFEADPAGRVTIGTVGDDHSVVLEPRELPTLTPRFHFSTNGLSQFLDEARVALFRGADAVVLVNPIDERLEQARAAAQAAGLDWDRLPKLALGGTSTLPAVHGPEQVVDAIGALACAALAAEMPPDFAHGADELRRWETFPRKAPPEPTAPEAHAPLGDLQLGGRTVLIAVGLAVGVVLLAVARVACQ